MKSKVLGDIFASLLLPLGVAIAFAGFMLMMVQDSYFPETPTIQIALGIAAGVAVAAVPLSLALKRLRFGYLGRFGRGVAGVIGAVLLTLAAWIVLVGDQKIAALVPFLCALPFVYLAAEARLLSDGVAKEPDAP